MLVNFTTFKQADSGLVCIASFVLWKLSMLSPVLTHEAVISRSLPSLRLWLTPYSATCLAVCTGKQSVSSAALPRTDLSVSSYFPVHNLWISWKFVSYVNTRMFKNYIILLFIAFLMSLGTSMLGHRLFKSVVLHFQAIENFLYHCFPCIFHSQNFC